MIMRKNIIVTMLLLFVFVNSACAETKGYIDVGSNGEKGNLRLEKLRIKTATPMGGCRGATQIELAPGINKKPMPIRPTGCAKQPLRALLERHRGR